MLTLALANLQLLAMDEVTIHYGQLDSDRLLLNYGFVIEDNRRDSIALDLTLDIVQVSPSWLEVAYVRWAFSIAQFSLSEPSL